MKKILKGYASLAREMFNLPNDLSFLSLPTGLVVLIVVCGVIGLIRNALSTYLHILPGYYSFHLDILWTMFNFPIYLFLFPGALLHWSLHRLGYQDVRIESIYGLSFHLQMIHLVVPFLDWLGYQLGMPWAHTVGTHIIRTHWYTNDIYMTPGIIAGWWITGYIVTRVFRQRLGIGWFATILTSLITFLSILIPTYFLFPGLNTLFNRTFGLLFWYPQDYLYDSPTWFLQWGSGTYFALTALLGLAYYVRWQRKEGSSI